MKYWLGVGAHPSFKVQKFLSYYDLFPAPIIKHGFRTVYPKPRKQYTEF